MRDNAERLRRYFVTAEGRQVDRDLQQGILDGPLRILIACDRDADLNRFDRALPTRIPTDPDSLPPNAVLGTDNWSMEQRDRRWLRTPEVHAYAEGYAVYTLRPEDRRGIEVVRPFDVRAIGLAFNAQLDNNLTFEEVLERWEKTPFDVAFESDGGRLLCLERNGADWSKKYWFDSAAGYMPVRIDATVVGRPSFASETTWREQDGAWLVDTMKTTEFDLSSDPEKPEFETLELAFQWESVNQPLDRTLFDAQKLGIHDFHRQVDVRGDRPVTVARVYPPGKEPRPRRVVVPKQSDTLKLVLIGNAVFLGLLAVLLIIKFRRQRREPSAS